MKAAPRALLVLWSAAATCLEAQESGLDSDTPRALARGFVAAANESDYARAARYIDLSSLPVPIGDPSRETLARQLKAILDRHRLPELTGLSASPEGDVRDGLPPRLERLATVPARHGQYDLLLERKTLPEGERWLVASGAVARIPVLFAEPRYGWLGRVLPEYYFRIEPLGLALWQWLGLLTLLPLSFLVALITAWIAHHLFSALVRRTKVSWDDLLFEKGPGPLRLLLGVAAFGLGARLLSLPLPLQVVLFVLAKSLVIVAVSWTAIRAVDVAARVARETPLRRDDAMVNTLVPMLRRVATLFIGAIALMFLLQNLGFNVSAVLAGLGIGGIAIALAAQKTVENLFGGISLLVDRPAKVGDQCRVGTYVGTIEEIGLRSTRIRTLDRTLVTVPNGELAATHIENLSARDRFRLETVLGLTYDTTPDGLRAVLTALKNLLDSHPNVLSDPCRVHFIGFGASALEVEIFAYVRTEDPDEFLAIRQDILLRIIDVVVSAGAAFAFPTQTLHLRRDVPVRATPSD